MLSRDSVGLLLVDVQEKLYPLVEHPCEVLHAMQQMIRGFQILSLPIVVTEQYPKGLGETIPALKQLLSPSQEYFAKTAFSAMGDESLALHLLSLPVTQWILMGIEAHICVLQTAKGLQKAGKEVIVLNNAISSRSIYDFSTAIAEMRDAKIRISCVETVLFEILKDSKSPEFKQISALVK